MDPKARNIKLGITDCELAVLALGRNRDTRYVLVRLVWRMFLPLQMNVCAIGFFNEADTLESSSILTYSHSKAGLYTHSDEQDVA
jgi:hypothetical protein